MDGIADQSPGVFEVQQEYQPPPQQPGYGQPPGAPPPGAPYGVPPPMPPVGPAERPTGVTVLGVLFIINAIFYFAFPVVGAVFLGMMFGVDVDLGKLFVGICLIVTLIFMIIGLINLIIAIGLLKLKNWARVIAMIFAVISLFNIPIGTILGIIILVYLTRPQVKAAFGR